MALIGAPDEREVGLGGARGARVDLEIDEGLLFKTAGALYPKRAPLVDGGVALAPVEVLEVGVAERPEEASDVALRVSAEGGDRAAPGGAVTGEGEAMARERREP